MKKVTATVFDVLSQFRKYFQEDGDFNESNEDPFFSELYSSEKMNKHGFSIAAAHKLLPAKKHKDQLLGRLDDNEATLLKVRQLLVENIRSGKAITPGAEWLLDNFYLIEEQIVLAKKHLPKGYSQGLPYLGNGMAPLRPRVYNIVLEIISHSDGRVDVTNLSSFVSAYQSHALLTIGELWAIPIMLQLAVIENLRRVCGKIALDMVDNNLAEYWAERMMITAKEEPADLVLTISDMARSNPMLSNTFVATFTRYLQGKGPVLALPLSWMEQQLLRIGASSNEMVRQENQKQAADQVSVRNSIGTLRFIGATDWREFVETLSSIEQVLRLDPAGIYSLMDFATRDRYRHLVESIAKRSSLPEADVAQKALQLAMEKAHEGTPFHKQRHVGYFLVDKGRNKLEELAGIKDTFRNKFSSIAKTRPFFVYMSAIFLFAMLSVSFLYYLLHSYYAGSEWVLVATSLVILSCVVQLAVSITNWLATLLVQPELLPRMNFSKNIPNECRTLIVVPTMLSGKKYIEALIEALEIRFLANKGTNLYYGLLTDFPDADQETLDEDEELLTLANEHIEALNEKYKGDGATIFYLFHRSRLWNASEHKWMGYERKRGKLAALNAFLRGKEKKEFSFVSNDSDALRGIKYVITLDSDTQLPRDAARKLIATMAHPLNSAIYDTEKKRVTEGYGILQPRLDSAIPQTGTSLYLRMQGDMAGIDPYTLVSSDVYQDLFGEGSFIGKGIYEVDIFEQAVDGVFQENRILSHDLIEGCYTRSGLVSDVYLYENNPAEYSSNIKRHERWIRGDWQIGAWMLPFITTGNGRLTKNRLSAISRWKILDNLRRSLLPISYLILLVLGWTILPHPWIWTATVSVILLLPSLLGSVWQLIQKPVDLTLNAHLREAGVTIRNTLLRFTFNISLLPYEAYKYSAAIIRTNWRMGVSKKKLLEWVPSAASSSDSSHNDVGAAYKAMWIAPLLALTCFAVLYARPDALLPALPILILWLLSPIMVWRLSAPEENEEPALPEAELQFLNKTARKTWGYFEAFVTAEDNWLPPDNFQEHPAAVVAHRTSPTNMGLALLANVTAWDFGYISAGRLISRCNDALQSMQKLERYRGHFLNWYDTQSLTPLKPRYVSAVDSGNLAGHLLTLRQALLGLCEQPVFGIHAYAGLKATVEIIRDIPGGINAITDSILGKLEIAMNDSSETLDTASEHLNTLAALISELNMLPPDNGSVLTAWANRLLLQINDLKDDLTLMAPWFVDMAPHRAFAHLAAMNEIPTLSALTNNEDGLLQHINAYEQLENSNEEKEWLALIRKNITAASAEAKRRSELLKSMAEQCEQMSQFEYGFLLDASTFLLRIGYNVDDQRKDNSFYDLLASEARLGIFTGIAQGKLPQESWFALGRLLTNSSRDPILLSWSGSMFEYLMPQLVMPSYENTLLHQTSKATVKRQIEYGAQKGTPWGISESAYNAVDTNMNYQYRAFGVPGLGLKRGLEEDLVIAPYATMMALMVSPAKASSNLQLLAEQGMQGEFGFYEAIDYTKARLPRGQTHSVIRSYMAHHQGMGLLSLSYHLLNRPMQRRFVRDLRFQATLLLLQERIPRATVFYAHTADVVRKPHVAVDMPVRVISTPHTAVPEVQLLGNSRYHVMVTNSGGGYSRWNDLAVNRWREDATRDNHGIFCYIKDVQTNDIWSNTYQPTLRRGKDYEAVFSQGHAEFRRHDHGIDTKTEIIVSPEDDTEIRRIKITNRTLSVKQLDITSYAEIVLAKQSSDEAHPAFSNLFVQTEILREHQAILCTRRSRSKEEQPPWMMHMMDVRGLTAETVSYETDRMKFIGRDRNLANPQAMNDASLSNSQGAVLDPIVSIRCRISLKPHQTVTVDLIYNMGETRETCERLMYKYRDQHLKDRAFELSWTHSQVLLRQINATEADTLLYDKLAASVIYNNPELRAASTVILGNTRGQSGLWSHSVSGDLPIVLLHIHDVEHFDIVKQMVQAHAYWRLKGLKVDLVIWNEDHGSYRRLLQEQIMDLVASAGSTHDSNGASHIFVRSADHISTDDRLLFESVARVIISANKGTLSEQVDRLGAKKTMPPLLVTKPMIQDNNATIALPQDLLFANGIGGFTPSGTEYKIITSYLQTTPAPWVNVLANPKFGTVISQSGSAYTWAVNAHEYRLTPWGNDPVSDIGGEAFYVRDEESGHFWSPMPFPAVGLLPYVTTHGFGYSTFEHTENGIATEVQVFVDKELPVKFIRLKVKNVSFRPRSLSATGFMEMVLGDLRARTNMHIISEYDNETNTVLLRNRYNTAFADRVTFFRVNDSSRLSFTADRTEFIGRNRNLSDPQAMHHKRLLGKVGACMDACAALQLKFELQEGEEKEIIFQLGSEENSAATAQLIRQLMKPDNAESALQQVVVYWKDILGAVHVSTPDPALNILANGWLTYQGLACRIFARSGFYQSGGAFGFRDQLQDVLALLHTQPQLVREQILLHASRQFSEGDVQHWWHPPEGKGVRTKCSDDLLWLPFVVSKYMSATGDMEILKKSVGFLESRPLHEDEDSLYDLPASGNLEGSLYEHCLRAIKHSLRFGKHGLPLMGSGDWNDGMDRVGNKGIGESVWLAFFLYDILQDFSRIAADYGDAGFADVCMKEAALLRTNIETSGWDGEWYKRAYFDDGHILGSKENNECRIDAIAQCWAVLSGAASDTRARTSMASLDKYLVKREIKLIQLLDPPFDSDKLDPGYIKGYVTGVRENGGQYSHAAVWTLMAFAALKDREKVWELFNMIQPINHALNADAVQLYKTEPYVMAADVYANKMHEGRGGWTWYTGSAGWMYQFIIGSLLGLQLRNDKLVFDPCFPLTWPSVSIIYRYKSTVYHIDIFQAHGSLQPHWQMDDTAGEGNEVRLIDDGLIHKVTVHA